MRYDPNNWGWVGGLQEDNTDAKEQLTPLNVCITNQPCFGTT